MVSRSSGRIRALCAFEIKVDKVSSNTICDFYMSKVRFARGIVFFPTHQEFTSWMCVIFSP